MVYFMGNPIKMDDLRIPPMSGNLHIVIFFGGFFKWGITQNHRFIVIDMLVFDIILVS